MTALNSSNGAPTTGLVFRMAPPMAAKAIALLVQARLVRSWASPGSGGLACSLT
jgi:hypothetical protein